MNAYDNVAAIEEMVPSTTVPSRSSFGLLRAKLLAWARDLADYYAAASAYENLSRLSDTQLKRLELSRDILARDLNHL
jgi:hypothetical protein